MDKLPQLNKARVSSSATIYAANTANALITLIHGIHAGKVDKLLKVDLANAEYHFEKLKEIMKHG